MTNQQILDHLKPLLDLEPNFLEVKLSQNGYGYYCRLIDDSKHPANRCYPHGEPPDTMLDKEAWYERFTQETNSIDIWIDREHSPETYWSSSADIPGCEYTSYRN